MDVNKWTNASFRPIHFFFAISIYWDVFPQLVYPLFHFHGLSNSITIFLGAFSPSNLYILSIDFFMIALLILCNAIYSFWFLSSLLLIFHDMNMMLALILYVPLHPNWLHDSLKHTLFSIQYLLLCFLYNICCIYVCMPIICPM